MVAAMQVVITVVNIALFGYLRSKKTEVAVASRAGYKNSSRAGRLPEARDN